MHSADLVTGQILIAYIPFGVVFVVAVYQALSAKWIERKCAYIMDWSKRQTAIYNLWQKKHKIMPYTGADIGFFLGLVWIVAVVIGIGVYVSFF